MLWGRDEHLFSDERDLVALAPVETDRLNIFLKDHFGYFFKVNNSAYSNVKVTLTILRPKRHKIHQRVEGCITIQKSASSAPVSS